MVAAPSHAAGTGDADAQASSERDLGVLLEAFVNQISHPRGRALTLMSEASVTVSQVILMSGALRWPRSTPSSLARTMGLSLPSISQIIDRLVRLGYLRRREDGADRRRKEIEVTGKARTFLGKLRAARVAEFNVSMAALTNETKETLRCALGAALREFDGAPLSMTKQVPET